ncbi:MAG: hypothetical protein EXQ57_08480 [Bryobacterales bacterium]|nr:hypothetical protein [Bryobacterales bacterium]
MLRRRWLRLLAQLRVDVNLPFSVRDLSGSLVLTLTKDDIEVLEDGVPQRIKRFSQGGESALSLGLLADAIVHSTDELLANADTGRRAFIVFSRRRGQRHRGRPTRRRHRLLRPLHRVEKRKVERT